MLLSKPQQQRFWRDWSQVKRSLKSIGYSDAQVENERHALLARAGFDSLTLVDHLAGFDRVLAELAVQLRPNDLEPQLREQSMPRTRLLFAIHQLANKFIPNLTNRPNPYLAAILRDRFGHCDLDRLTEPQLLQLRNTLAARLASKRRKSAQPVETNNPF